MSDCRIRATLVGDAVEVDRHVLERGHEDRDRILTLGAADVRILAAEDLLGERQHSRLVRLRHAEDAHDHVQRIEERDVAREVALAVEIEHAVDEAPRELRETRAELFSQVGRLEPFVRDLAVGAVLGAVHVDQCLDVHAERAAVLDLRARQEHRIPRVPEEPVVALHLGDVRVARDHAKREVTVDLHERQWIVPAQPLGRRVPLGEIRIGHAVDEDPLVAEPSEVGGHALESRAVAGDDHL